MLEVPGILVPMGLDGPHYGVTMMMMPLSTFYVPSTVYGVIAAAAAAAKSLLSCPTLCNPRDGSLPGSSVSPHQSESESKVT